MNDVNRATGRGGELGQELGDGEEEPAQRGVGGVMGGATARQRLNGGEQARADEEGRVGGDERQAEQLEELRLARAIGGRLRRLQQLANPREQRVERIGELALRRIPAAVQRVGRRPQLVARRSELAQRGRAPRAAVAAAS